MCNLLKSRCISLLPALSQSIAAATLAALLWQSSPPPANADDKEKNFSGNVSWYGAQLNGKKTASGQRFDMTKSTAAHRKLPFQTKVLVEDPKSGKSVVVVVNDRGPFTKSRVMDISREGARRLGTLSRGAVFADCTIVNQIDAK